MRLEIQDEQTEEGGHPQRGQQPAPTGFQLDRIAAIHVADEQQNRHADDDRQNPIGVRLDASPFERGVDGVGGPQRRESVHHAAPP